MNIHKNARLTPHGRAELARRVVEDGHSIGEIAAAFHVCVKTARKWAERFRRSGVEGLSDVSSRPHRLLTPTPQAVILETIALRRQRFTGKHIAKVTGVSTATVSRVLRRAKLSEPAEPVKRYERQSPGELIHIDIKKLGRFERVGHQSPGPRQNSMRSSD